MKFVFRHPHKPLNRGHGMSQITIVVTPLGTRLCRPSETV